VDAFLKCDAEGCDHRETVGGLSADLIGKPCPKCGANLLTEEDFRSSQSMVAAVEFMKALGLVKDPSEATGNETVVTWGHHNGTTTITAKER